VIVQQLNEDNPLVNRLAKPVIDQYQYPSLHEKDAWKDQIKALIASELAEKVPEVKTASSP
jgi:hypothetical protein